LYLRNTGKAGSDALCSLKKNFENIAARKRAKKSPARGRAQGIIFGA